MDADKGNGTWYYAGVWTYLLKYARMYGMSKLRLDEDIKPVTEFRANAATLIEQIRATGRPLVLTQRGYSAAVVVDVREYERLLDELELLRDIQIAERQLADGQGVPHEQACEQIRGAIRR